MMNNFTKLILHNTYSLHNLSFQKSLITLNNLIHYNLYCAKANNCSDRKLTEKDLTPINKDDEISEIKTIGDIQHKLRLSRYHRRHDVEFYMRLIKKAALEGNKEKMLTIFFHDMLIIDRVKPSLFLVNILLKKLADLGGHSEAAFKILKKVKDLQMEPSSVTYSLVFKNCSKEIGNNELFWNLSKDTVKLVSNEEMEKIQQPAIRALKIWKNLREENQYLEIGAVNSLLLTLGRAGMLKETFVVLDTFLQDGNRPDSYTLVAMLEGCLVDRTSGFGLALAVYNRLVYTYKCTLSPYVFSTLLKVIQSCQFGNDLLIQKIIQSASFNTNQHHQPDNHPQTFVSFFQDDNNEKSVKMNVSNSVDHCAIHWGQESFNEIIQTKSEKFGIAARDFIQSHWSQSNALVYCLKSPTNMLQKNFVNFFDLKWLQGWLEPSEKLACVGGVLGIVSQMQQHQIVPNIVTLTSMIGCLPYKKSVVRNLDTGTENDSKSEEFFATVIRSLANHFKLQQETAFNNALYKRNIQMINASDLYNQTEVLDSSAFDPLTWSIYGKKCRLVEDVNRFFQLLQQNQVHPNSEMFYTLMRSVSTWGARLNIIQRMQHNRVPLSRSIIVQIEDEIGKNRKKLRSLAETELDKLNLKAFYKFQQIYSEILDETRTETVTTGDRKIFIDDLPACYRSRET